MRESEIIDTAREAHADLKATYPDLIPEWRELNVQLDRGTRRKGATHYRYDYTTRQYVPSKITLSKYAEDRYGVDNTFRHEMAHWLAGHAAAHGPEWQRMAVKCGTSPERCSDSQLNVPRKRGYSLKCGTDNCSWEKVHQRRTRSLTYPHAYRCPNCGHANLYTE